MSSPEPSGNDVIVFQSGDVQYVLSQIARLGEGLKAEFDLIAGRMSWLVISESFIFSAFATAIANYRPDHPAVGGLLFLAWVLPCVGIILTIFVYVAILAALSAVEKLKRQRDRMMAGLPAHLRIDLISTESPQEWWGDLPARALPPVLFLFWALAFLLALT
jgi:hypothetical protein